MLWILLFLALALAGLVTLISYAVWLAHKTADVLSEVAMLGDQAGRLADLLGQIRLPGDEGDPDSGQDPLLPGRIDVR